MNTISEKQAKALRIVAKVGQGSHLMIHHATFDSLTKRGLIWGGQLTDAGRAALEEFSA